jgi:hypothetical protein
MPHSPGSLTPATGYGSTPGVAGASCQLYRGQLEVTDP